MSESTSESPRTDSNAGTSATPALGMSLAVEDGRARVTLANQTLASGLVLRTLELGLVDAELPLDVGGGAKAFQRHATELDGFILECSLGCLARELDRACGAIGAPIRNLQLVIEGGSLALEGEVQMRTSAAPFFAPILLAPSGTREIRVNIGHAQFFGYSPLTGLDLVHHVERSIQWILEQLGTRAAQSFRRAGPRSFVFDPIVALLWAVLPKEGWRLPRTDDATLVEVAPTQDGTLVVTASSPRWQPRMQAVASRPPETSEENILDAMAREDAERGEPEIDRMIERGDRVSAFHAMRSKLDASGGPDSLLDRVLELGATIPEVHAAVLELANDRAVRVGHAISVSTARAAVAAYAQDSRETTRAREDLARQLIADGKRRAAGLALREASRMDGADRVALLEETITLRPDDESALDALMHELPRAGREQAALRAARRLAHVGLSPETRAKSHAFAGDLLRTALGDPTQAQREYERALRLCPEHTAAIEGLARVVMERGDTRRAAELLDDLATRADNIADPLRAAELCNLLGDLWRDRNPDAAIARYRRALERCPDHLGALARLARIAVNLDRREMADEVIDHAQVLLDAASSSGDARDLHTLRLLAGEQSEARGEDPKRAIHHYEVASLLEPTSDAPLARLEHLHTATGDSAALGELRARRANLWIANGRIDDAASLLRTEITRSSDNPAALSRIRDVVATHLARHDGHRGMLDAFIDVAEARHDVRDAIEALARRLAVENEPMERSRLSSRLAVALEASGRILEAVRAHDEAIATDPSNVVSLDALAKIHRQRGDDDALLRTLSHAVHHSKDAVRTARLAFERAQVFERLERHADAYDAIRPCLVESRRDPRSLELATRLALRLERFEQADTFLQQRRALGLADASRSTRAALLLDAARVDQALGRADGAIATLLEARTLAEPTTELGLEVESEFERALTRLGRLADLHALARERAARAGTPSHERVAHLLCAAHHAVALGDRARAAEDAQDALATIDDEVHHDRDLEDAALRVLEPIAREDADVPTVVGILERRLRSTSDRAVKEALRLEQASLWEGMGDRTAATAVLERAFIELPQAGAIAEQLGRVARDSDRASLAASAFARAARLAEDDRQFPRAIEMHGLAAATSTALGDALRAEKHDRRLVEIAPVAHDSKWLRLALDRLEAAARRSNDVALLVDILGKRAAIADPAEAARLYLEKSSLDLRTPSGVGAALDSLRRARAVGVRGSETDRAVDAATLDLLSRHGLHRERATFLAECATRASDRAERSRLHLESARSWRADVHDGEAALAELDAAIAADDSDGRARALRIELLRETNRRERLADALVEDADTTTDAARAASALTEAASLLLPRDAESATSLETQTCVRGLGLARRASELSKGDPEPLRLVVAYTRRLGRHREEYAALAGLIAVERDPARILALRLRRILMEGIRERVASETIAEIEQALAVVSRVDGSVIPAIEAQLAPEMRARFSFRNAHELERRLLDMEAEISRTIEDWTTHVHVLLRLADRVDEPSTRADVRSNAGEILEWKLGDAEGALREYRSALALCPDHEGARAALEAFYASLDRFADLAENLGVAALRKTWIRIREEGRAPRTIAAAEALWPRLPEGDVERARIQLELATLYAETPSRDADIVDLLDQVARTGPVAEQAEALSRLRDLFSARERWDLYCDVLRRQADRIVDDHERAIAVTRVGEALEWKLGDGRAAEREYRAAIALDATCANAATRLLDLLASNDRFDEIARELGIDALGRVARELIDAGDRHRHRAFSALEVFAGAAPPHDRAAHWLRFATAIEQSRDFDIILLRTVLERATRDEGESQLCAFDRLIPLLRDTGDRAALANALRQRVDLERDPSRAHPLHRELGMILLGMCDESASNARAVIEREAERELRAAHALEANDPQVRAALEQLFLGQDRFRELGEVLGEDHLAAVRDRVERGEDRERARLALRALADLSMGERRAARLLELIDSSDPDATAVSSSVETEELFLAALEADPKNERAREGLRALLENQHRYRELGDTLGADALRATLADRERADDRDARIAAGTALLELLERHESSRDERVSLLFGLSALHFARTDVDAARAHLLRVLDLEPGHREAREEIRKLYTARGELAALASIDPQLVETTRSLARATGDGALELASLRALSASFAGTVRVDALVEAAAVAQRIGRVDEAEAHLLEALRLDPARIDARAELGEIFWNTRRPTELATRFGSDALLARARVAIQGSFAEASDALEAVRASLEPAAAATADEILASGRNPALSDIDDSTRRLFALESARRTWDRLPNPEGQMRVRLAIRELHRARGDFDALLIALADAAEVATDPTTLAELSLERAHILVPRRRCEAARSLVEPVFEDAGVAMSLRLDAARILADDLIAGDPASLSLVDLELRTHTLELLAAHAPSDGEAVRRLGDLSSARDALGADPREVAQPLEQACELASRFEDTAQRVEIERRLRDLYEQTGDWQRAERSAAIVAKTDDLPGDWIALSELRSWLGDRDGATTALERALAVDPASRRANESLVRLAEREGKSDSAIARLVAWAEADRTGTPKERAERMLEAAEHAATAGDTERATELAERALRFLEPRDAHIAEIADRACAILDAMGYDEAIIRTLTHAIGLSPATPAMSISRVRLADLLQRGRRGDEARTVLEHGLRSDMDPTDPVATCFVEHCQRLPADLGAQRMSSCAERLDAGPLSRFLAKSSAEFAEASGHLDLARDLWMRIARAPADPDDTRAALEHGVRLARCTRNDDALVDALAHSSEHARPMERGLLLLEAAEVADTRLGDTERAEILLSRALVDARANVEVRARAIEMLAARRRHLDIELLFDAALAEASTDAERLELHIARANHAEEKLGDPALAARAFEDAFDCGGRIEHAERAAFNHLRSGDFRRSAAMARQARGRIPPESVEAQTLGLLLVDALAAAGSRDDAARELHALASTFPSRARVKERAIEFLEAAQDWPALACALLDPSGHPEPARALRSTISAARVFLLAEDEPRARMAMARAIEIARTAPLEPLDPELRIPLFSASSFPAANDYRECVHPLLHLAAIAAQGDAIELERDALACLAACLPDGPARSSVRVGVAAVRERCGDYSGAMDDLRGLLAETTPTSGAALDSRTDAELALALLSANHARFDDARALAQSASERVAMGTALRDDRRIDMLVTSARIERMSGNFDGALDAMAKARAIDPNAVPRSMWDRALESASCSPRRARLLEWESVTADRADERARHLERAAAAWRAIGRDAHAMELDLQRSRLVHPNEAETQRLEAMLSSSERWEELEELELRCSRNVLLGSKERAAHLVARAKIARDRFGRREEAFTIALEAIELEPQDPVVLDCVVRCARSVGSLSGERRALSALAHSSADPELCHEACARIAELCEGEGDEAGAISVLEEAYARALVTHRHVHALADWLERIHRRRDDWEACARLWMRMARATTGAEAAAALSRAADLRIHRLSDRRSALIALDTATEHAPNDLAIRRAATRLRRAFDARTHDVSTTVRGEMDEASRAAAFVEEGRQILDELRDAQSFEAFDEHGAEKLERARRAFERGLAIMPDDVDALGELARLHARCREFARASELVAKLAPLGGPCWPVPEFELFAAEIARSRGDVGEATQWIEKARSRDPGSIAVLRAAAWLAEHVDDPARAERWLIDAASAMDSSGHRAERVSLFARLADLALARGDRSSATEYIGRAIVQDPVDAELRARRRAIVLPDAPSPEFADAAFDDALVATGPVVQDLLESSFDASLEIGDRARAMRAAGAMDFATAHRDVRTRLLAFFASTNHALGLLRVVDAHGDGSIVSELGADARVTLARGHLAMGRGAESIEILAASIPDDSLASEDRLRELAAFERRIARAFAPSGDVEPDEIDVLTLVVALERCELRASPSRALTSIIEALCALHAERVALAARLATIRARAKTQSAASAKVIRHALAKEPTALDLVETLERVTEDPMERSGAHAIAAVLRGSASAPIAQLPFFDTRRDLWSAICDAHVKTPLGELLEIAAVALAARAEPRAFDAARMRPAPRDPRLTDVLGDLQLARAGAFAAFVDPFGGRNVAIAPADPCRMVFGESLVADGALAEIRFFAARACVMLRLGFAPFDERKDVERQALVRELVASLRARGAGISHDGSMMRALEAHLSMEDMARAIALAETMDEERAVAMLLPWAHGVVRSANRFGALAAGDLRVAIDALSRSDPLSRGERFDTEDARAAAVRRNPLLSDLTAFVLSRDYMDASNVIASMGTGRNRF